MDERRFAAQLLMSAADSIASEASRALVTSRPEVASRYGPLALDRWKENFHGRLADLAAAVLAGRAAVFVDQVAWSRLAFEARGVPVEDLRASLEVLSETLIRELPPEDQPWVLGVLASARRRLNEPPHAQPPGLTRDTPHAELASRYLLAILEGDRAQACELVVSAVRAGTLGVPQAYELVLIPVQAELGRMWHINDLTIAEEHFATATTQMVMSQLYPFMSRAPSNGRVVIAACVEGNTHDVGVRMLADYFEIAGWRAVFLGANVPAGDLAMAVEHFRADVLALSACLPTQLRAVEDAIAAARVGEHRPVKIIVGGPAFANADSLWQELGADGYAPTAQGAVGMAEGWMAEK
jgi:MerR family transcriptional regulator, light-induced transcriptional regulator